MVVGHWLAKERVLGQSMRQFQVEFQNRDLEIREKELRLKHKEIELRLIGLRLLGLC